MISKKLLEEVMFDTIKKSSCFIPDDVKQGIKKAIKSAEKEETKIAFKNTLESLELSKKRKNLACPDTGWPLFFCKIGNEAKIEGGIMALEDIGGNMVAKATKKGYLRSTMKHPLSGYDPGTNVGVNMPDFSYKFVPGSNLEITFVAKGGGSECFGGTRYRMIAFADGLEGIEKFIVDAFIASGRAGAVCPPPILGIGIGGTANVATQIAKEAACLRTIKSRHPEANIADIEDNLYVELNKLGVGPMGSGGNTSVLSVNVEYSYTHLAGIAVATSTNCLVGRRATTRIYHNGETEELGNPDWFERSGNNDNL